MATQKIRPEIRRYMGQTIYGIDPRVGFRPNCLYPAKIDDVYFISGPPEAFKKVPFDLRSAVDGKQELALHLGADNIYLKHTLRDFREIVHFLNECGVEDPRKFRQIEQIKGKLVSAYTEGGRLGLPQRVLGIGV